MEEVDHEEIEVGVEEEEVVVDLAVAEVVVTEEDAVVEWVVELAVVDPAEMETGLAVTLTVATLTSAGEMNAIYAIHLVLRVLGVMMVAVEVVVDLVVVAAEVDLVEAGVVIVGVVIVVVLAVVEEDVVALETEVAEAVVLVAAEVGIVVDLEVVVVVVVTEVEETLVVTEETEDPNHTNYCTELQSLLIMNFCVAVRQQIICAVNRLNCDILSFEKICLCS